MAAPHQQIHQMYNQCTNCIDNDGDYDGGDGGSSGYTSATATATTIQHTTAQFHQHQHHNSGNNTLQVHQHRPQKSSSSSSSSSASSLSTSPLLSSSSLSSPSSSPSSSSTNQQQRISIANMPRIKENDLEYVEIKLDDNVVESSEMEEAKKQKHSNNNNVNVIVGTNTNTNSNFKQCLYRLLRHNLHWFPWMISLIVPVLSVTVYAYAVLSDHIEPILPFVSDAATRVPQAAFFAQTLDLLTVLTLITTLARYKQIKYYVYRLSLMDHNGDGGNCGKSLMTDETTMDGTNQQVSSTTKNNSYSISYTIVCIEQANFRSTLVSYFNCICLFGVGNYRCGEQYTLHTIAASLLFIGIIIYGAYQHWIASLLHNVGHFETKPITMCAVVYLATISLILTITFNVHSFILFGNERYMNTEERLHWNSTSPGYVSHVIGTTFEWITINTFPLLYLCIGKRMKVFGEWDQVRFWSSQSSAAAVATASLPISTTLSNNCVC